ncbi:phage protein [Marichromatium gracile]|uniref:DUF3653 domain-containing protein n=1 Tax=Marichromatium gracile TaxID=1048 RepID=UPI001F4061E3|nr:DUF3653 domain-containing protein [Marichromatium gracile]MCF1183542.1 phage protein [Marichromatium gracile]
MKNRKRVDVEGWEGWYFDEAGYLVDPARNKYRPSDFPKLFWARQAWEARAGNHPGQIAFLRERLETERRRAKSTVVIEVTRETEDGEEVIQTIRVKA